MIKTLTQQEHKLNPHAPALKLSPVPQKAAEEMIKIIEALHDIYVRETEFLKASDTQGFQTIQQEKMEATRNYEQGMTQMLARKAEMKTISDSLKDMLRKLQEKFQQISTENKEMLERMVRTTERLGSTIRNAAKDAISKRTSGGYGSTGALTTPTSRNMSIGLNETI